MNKNPNTDNMLAKRKEYSKECVENVISTITEMKSLGAIWSKSEICRKAGVSTNFFNRHPELYKVYDEATGKRSHKKKDVQTADNSMVVITSLRSENNRLKKELEKAMTALELVSTYKETIANLEQKNKDLQEKLNEYYSKSLL